MKKTCLFLGICLTFLSPGEFQPPLLSLPQAGPKVPLTEAINAGLGMNHEVQNASLDLDLADLQHRLSAKSKLPRLGLDAGYMYRSETPGVTFPPIQIPDLPTIPGREIVAGLHHNFDLKLGLVQPLFSGGILTRSIKLEEVRGALEVNRKSLKENEIAGRVKASFFAYQFLARRKQSLLVLERTLDLHRRRIENLLDEGLVRKSDLLETLSRIEEIRASASDVEQAVEAEKIRFQDITGYLPEEIDDSYREEPIGRDEAGSYFEKFHPVLKTLRDQAEILAIQEKIAAGRYLPQVNGFAELHYGKPGIDFFEKKWSVYFQAGVTVSMPVFDGNRLRVDKTVLETRARKLENERSQFVRDVDTTLATLYSSLRKLEEKKAHLLRLLEYSREDADLKEALYAEKQIPNVDFLAALLNREKNALLLEEIEFQKESIKVNINTLIVKNREDADE